jgi:hypothetical protein
MSDLIRLLKTALQQGWRFGLVLGGIWVAYDLINNLGHLGATGYGRLNTALPIALVGLYAWAGLRRGYSTGQVRTGILAAVGASLIGSVIAISSLWIVTGLFLDTIRHNPYMIEDFRRSGMASMDAFIVDDNLVPTFLGPVFSVLLGAAVGTLGGVIGKWLHGGPGGRAHLLVQPFPK